MVSLVSSKFLAKQKIGAKSLLFKCMYTVDFGKNKESKEKPLTVKIVSLASIVLPAERELNTVGPNHLPLLISKPQHFSI